VIPDNGGEKMMNIGSFLVLLFIFQLACSQEGESIFNAFIVFITTLTALISL
jgi:hypothetical protein